MKKPTDDVLNAKQGDVLVVLGGVAASKDTQGRALVKYEGADELIKWFRYRDDPTGAVFTDNDDYMIKVATYLRERTTVDLVSARSPEAFIASLARVGIVTVAILN